MAGLFYGGIKLEVITGGTNVSPENNVAVMYIDETHHVNIKKHDNTFHTLAQIGDISSVGMSTFDGRYINVTGGNLLGQLVLTDTASIVPVSDGVVTIGTSSNRLSHLHANEVHVGSSSLFVNGKKVLSDTSGTITVSTDVNQHLDVKTTGSGIVKVESDQEVLILTNGTAKDINVQASGNVNFTGNSLGITLVNPNTATINTNTIETRNNKGAANGYAELDSNSKIPMYRIPDSLVGNVNYQGGWAGANNIPAIVAATSANKGWYYVTATAVASGHGYPNVPNVDFQIGDWIISNGTLWQKIDNTDAVVSVFGRIGSVIGISGDYSAAQVMVTPIGNITSINVQSALQELDNIKANSSVVTNQATQIATISANQTNYSLTSTVSSVSAGLDTRISTINALDINQAFQIAALSGQDISQASQIASLSANPIPDIFRSEIVAISSGLDARIATGVSRDNNQDILIAALNGQVTSINALDANQATQIAAISANYALSSFVVSASANALAQSDNYSDARDANQDTLIASISAQVLANTSTNQAAQIAAISASNIINTNAVAYLASVTGGFALTSSIAGLTGSLQSQITTINALDANQATQITTISANNTNQDILIASISANYTPTVITAAISAGLDTRITTGVARDNNQDTLIASISANYALTSFVVSASANALAQANNVSSARDNNQDTLIASISANYALTSFVVSASANALNQANNVSSARDTNQDTLIASISAQIVSNTALDANQATQIASISASLGNYAVTTSVANASANALTQADNYSDARDSNQDTLIAAISANYALSSFVVSASANALAQANNVSSARDNNQDTLIASISGQVLANQALDANQATQIASISASLGGYALTSLVSSASANALAQADNYSDARNANQDTLIASISANYALSSFVVSASANALNQANNVSSARDNNQDTLIAAISASYTPLTTTSALTGSLLATIAALSGQGSAGSSGVSSINSITGAVSILGGYGNISISGSGQTVTVATSSNMYLVKLTTLNGINNINGAIQSSSYNPNSDAEFGQGLRADGFFHALSTSNLDGLVSFGNGLTVVNGDVSVGAFSNTTIQSPIIKTTQLPQISSGSMVIMDQSNNHLGYSRYAVSDITNISGNNINQDTLIANISGQVVATQALDANQATQIANLSASLGSYALSSLVASSSANALAQSDNYSDARDSNQDTLIASISANYALSAVVSSASANALVQSTNASNARDNNQDTLIASISGQVVATQALDANQATQIANISASLGNYAVTTSVANASANALTQADNYSDARDNNQDTLIASISANYASATLVSSASANALAQADNYSDVRDSNQDTLITAISATFTPLSTTQTVSGNLYAIIAASSGQSGGVNNILNKQIAFSHPAGQISGSNVMTFDPSVTTTGRVLFSQIIQNQLPTAQSKVSNVRIDTTMGDMNTANQGTYIGTWISTQVGNLTGAASSNAGIQSLLVSYDETNMGIPSGGGSWNGSKVGLRTEVTEICGSSAPFGQSIVLSHGSQQSRTVGGVGLSVNTSMDRPGSVGVVNVVQVAGSQTAGSVGTIRGVYIPGGNATNTNQMAAVVIDLQKKANVNYGIGIAQLSGADNNFFAGSVQVGGNIRDITGNGAGNLVVTGNISGLGSVQVAYNTDIITLSANGINQDTLIAQLSGSQNLNLYTLLTTTAGLTGSLQNQIIAINALDANQASQIAALSASPGGGIPASTVAAISAGLYSFTNAASANALTQADNYSDARNANQDTLIAQISGNYTPLSTTQAISGLFVQKTGDTMTGRLTITNQISGAPLEPQESGGVGALRIVADQKQTGAQFYQYSFGNINNSGYRMVTADGSAAAPSNCIQGRLIGQVEAFGRYDTNTYALNRLYWISEQPYATSGAGTSFHCTYIPLNSITTTDFLMMNANDRTLHIFVDTNVVGMLSGSNLVSANGISANGSVPVALSTDITTLTSRDSNQDTQIAAISANYALSSFVVSASANALVQADNYSDARNANQDTLIASISAQIVANTALDSNQATQIASISANYALTTLVSSASANALVQADNYSDARNSNQDTLIAAISANYALITLVSSASANALVQADNYSDARNANQDTLISQISGNYTPLVTTAATSAKLYAIIAASSGSNTPTTITNHGAITFIIDGGGVAPGTGFQNYVQCPYSGTIQSWTIVGDASGTCAVDVWKGTYAQFPLTVSQSIVSTDAPSLSGTRINQNAAVSVWSVQVSAGDLFGFNLNAVSGITKISTTINILKVN